MYVALLISVGLLFARAAGFTIINKLNSHYPLKAITKDAATQFSLGKIAFSLVPLSPESVGRRKTILTEVVPDKIWTLDQLQGVINVNGMKLPKQINICSLMVSFMFFKYLFGVQS